VLKQNLQEAFRRSPWYDEASERVLFASLEPRFDFTQEKRPVQLTHAYLVKVPYESDEAVEVITWVPDDRVVNISGLDGKIRTEVVRDSKRVTKTEFHKITRYRDEVRHIPYEATQFELEASLSWDLRTQSPFFDQAKKSYLGTEGRFFIHHGS